MFWGCFLGRAGKGPRIFWEKDWGSINEDIYQVYTVPIIYSQIRLYLGYIFIQDRALGYTKKETIEDLIDRRIQRINQPPFSLDLNPIENVQNQIKDQIQQYYPYDSISYNQLRKTVSKAWEAVPDSFLLELLRSIKARCQAIINANGIHTKYQN